MAIRVLVDLHEPREFRNLVISKLKDTGLSVEFDVKNRRSEGGDYVIKTLEGEYWIEKKRSRTCSPRSRGNVYEHSKPKPAGKDEETILAALKLKGEGWVPNPADRGTLSGG